MIKLFQSQLRRKFNDSAKTIDEKIQLQIKSDQADDLTSTNR
jgi:hypothetical protein